MHNWRRTFEPGKLSFHNIFWDVYEVWTMIGSWVYWGLSELKKKVFFQKIQNSIFQKKLVKSNTKSILFTILEVNDLGPKIYEYLLLFLHQILQCSLVVLEQSIFVTTIFPVLYKQKRLPFWINRMSPKIMTAEMQAQKYFRSIMWLVGWIFTKVMHQLFYISLFLFSTNEMFQNLQ